MPNKFYSLPKSVFEHYHAKIKDWVRAVLPTKTSDLTNDSDFLDQLALAGIIAVTFSASSTYKVGDYVLYNHTLYRCKTAITTAGAWDATKWDAAKTQDIFSGSAPGLVPSPSNDDSVLAGDGLWKNVEIIGKADIDALDWDARPTIKIGEHEYPYVQIGNLLWTAKNLYEPIGTRDVNYKPITIYGNEVLPDDRGFIYTSSTMTSILNSLVLPEGWRIPTNNDYETLKSVGGNALRTLSGWKSINNMVPTDSFGFSLYPNVDFEYAYLISSNKRESDGAYYSYSVWSGGNSIGGPTIYNQAGFGTIRLCKDV